MSKSTDILWRQVVGFPNYEVSSTGLVRRATSGRNAVAGTILHQSFNTFGYLHVSLGSKYLTYPVHKLVADAFLGQRPHGTSVNHKDAVKTHNSAPNLEYITAQQNSIHMRVNGLQPSKLTKEQALEIYHLYHIEHTSRVRLATMFGISRQSVHDIVSGKTWAWATHNSLSLEED